MKKLIIVLCLGVVIGLVIALASAEMIEKTSGREFCVMCHSMEGMVAAYENDIHGGANERGLVAKCVDCHLPHDSVTGYVVEKARTGIRDVLGEMFWVDSKDWEANLANRDEYVFSSGCLKCHDLTLMKYQIPKAYLGHKAFLSGDVTSCVACHEHVGHKNMKDYLVKPTEREEK